MANNDSNWLTRLIGWLFFWLKPLEDDEKDLGKEKSDYERELKNLGADEALTRSVFDLFFLSKNIAVNNKLILIELIHVLYYYFLKEDNENALKLFEDTYNNLREDYFPNKDVKGFKIKEFIARKVKQDEDVKSLGPLADLVKDKNNLIPEINKLILKSLSEIKRLINDKEGLYERQIKGLDLLSNDSSIKEWRLESYVNQMIVFKTNSLTYLSKEIDFLSVKGSDDLISNVSSLLASFHLEFTQEYTACTHCSVIVQKFMSKDDIFTRVYYKMRKTYRNFNKQERDAFYNTYLKKTYELSNKLINALKTIIEKNKELIKNAEQLENAAKTQPEIPKTTAQEGSTQKVEVTATNAGIIKDSQSIKKTAPKDSLD